LESKQRPSFMVAALTAAVVVVAAVLSFPIRAKALVFNLSLWLIQFVFTYYLITRIGRASVPGHK
jgi:hypothetical protein